MIKGSLYLIGFVSSRRLLLLIACLKAKKKTTAEKMIGDAVIVMMLYLTKENSIPLEGQIRKKKSSKGQLETTELKISILSGYTVIS